MKRPFALAALVLVSCGPAEPAPRSAEVVAPASCDFGSSAIAPFAAEWPAMWGVEAKAAAQRGVLVASFDGCTLRLLSACQGEPEQPYELVLGPPSSTRLEMRSAEEIRQRMPMGAADLARELPPGGLLRFEAQKRGSLIWTGAPTRLSGECEGATHFVRAIEVGAYALDAEPAPGSAEAPSRVRSGGRIAACASTDGSTVTDGCTAMLQLVLEPFPERAVLHAFDAAAPRRPRTDAERARLCAEYREDRARLAELLGVQNEDLVSRDDKARFQLELDARYRSVADVVRTCPP